MFFANSGTQLFRFYIVENKIMEQPLLPHDLVMPHDFGKSTVKPVFILRPMLGKVLGNRFSLSKVSTSLAFVTRYTY